MKLALYQTGIGLRDLLASVPWIEVVCVIQLDYTELEGLWM